MVLLTTFHSLLRSNCITPRSTTTQRAPELGKNPSLRNQIKNTPSKIPTHLYHFRICHGTTIVPSNPREPLEYTPRLFFKTPFLTQTNSWYQSVSASNTHPAPHHPFARRKCNVPEKRRKSNFNLLKKRKSRKKKRGKREKPRRIFVTRRFIRVAYPRRPRVCGRIAAVTMTITRRGKK